MPTHSGFYSTTISGTVVNGDNVNYGTLPGAYGELTVPGNFAIANGNGYPLVQIQAGTIVSPLGTLNIGYANPNITIDLAGGGSPATAFNVQNFVAPGTDPVVPLAGVVTIDGASVAAAGIPVRSNSIAANALQIEVQRASGQALSSAANAGLASFNNGQFTVDGNGFVSLAGGGLAIDQIGVDFATAPGVTPVDPTALGLITVNGVAVAQQAIPVRSHSIALNQLQIEVQRAASSAVSDVTSQGVASFDSAHFLVDGNGYVSNLNGLAVTRVDVQANTAPGTDPVLANASGVIQVNGTIVAAQLIPIRTNSLAANAYDIETQYSSAQAVDTPAAAGMCSFDSSQFSVSATGFVQSLSSGGITWQDSAPVVMSFNNGYFATGAGAYTLPLGASTGDVVEIIDNIGGGVVVTASGAETIRIQNTNSSAGGTATSTQFGDALRLIYRGSIGEWQCYPGAGGNWLLA
jgi:hypothetical protein